MESVYQPASPSTSTEDRKSRMVKRQARKGRVRVTRACDRCKRRKIKCNGTQPCHFCLRAKAECTFVTSYARGRAPNIPASLNEGDDIGSGTLAGIATTGHRLSQARSQYAPILPRPEPAQATNAETNPSLDSELEDTEATPDYVETFSPEPSQADEEGHYIGPASGVSFLLRIQKRLHQAISFSQPSSIFTFGDAPLHIPESDPSFCMMLPRDDAQKLLDRYFDFAMPTYRFLHRPTLQEWFTEFYDTLGVMNDSNSSPAKVALLFMVFAQARVYMPDNDKPGPHDLSTRYFLAAEHHLKNEKGSIRLTSVQARLLQCYFLLTQSRINHCWSLFGTVSHLSLAIGLNRNRPANIKSGLGLVESECRRRTFWCAYTLDAYLSAALGRPRTFHDDDIDTELPASLEDEDLLTDLPISSIPSRNQSTMLAALAHMKIAQIISKILTTLYSIKPVSTSRQETALQEITTDLNSWRSELSWFLDVDISSMSFFIPIFQRQRNVLNLTYWHAMILTHRPYVLNNFARLSRRDGGNNLSNDDPKGSSLEKCLDASMKTVNTINEITGSRQLFRAFWVTAYFAFNATIMLYIYVIQESASPPHVWTEYLTAATQCQSHLSAIAEKGSLSERYSLVLEELRLEALRQTKSINPCVSGPAEMDVGMQDTSLGDVALVMDGDHAAGLNPAAFAEDSIMDFDASIPGFSLTDYSGWGQFTSMVSSGLGNMEMFLS